MKEKIIIVALLLLAIYLYYQNRKLKGLPHSDTPLTVFNLGEQEEDLIAEKDQLTRDKGELEQEVLSLSNKLKLKQQETTRKEQEIERVKKEKSQVEIALNEKIKELKKDLEGVKKKYSERERLLDEEQTDNNKLTEKVAELEQQITELQRARSPIPGEFPAVATKELEQQHNDQLRQINLLFDENAKNYQQIDFNGLLELLKGVSRESEALRLFKEKTERERERAEAKEPEIAPIYSRQRKKKY